MNVRNGIENLPQIVTTQPVSNPASARGAGGALGASLAGSGTDKAQLSNVATQAAQSAPASDVRLDKVAAIQSALQAGTYRVPASEVAQKVIASMLTPEQ